MTYLENKGIPIGLIEDAARTVMFVKVSRMDIQKYWTCRNAQTYSPTTTPVVKAEDLCIDVFVLAAVCRPIMGEPSTRDV
jgi:hypothetical protein